MHCLLLSGLKAAMVIIVVNMILSFILFGKKDKWSRLYRIPMWIFDCVTGNVMYVSFINLLKAGRKGMRIFRVKLPLSFGEGFGGEVKRRVK